MTDPKPSVFDGLPDACPSPARAELSDADVDAAINVVYRLMYPNVYHRPTVSSSDRAIYRAAARGQAQPPREPDDLTSIMAGLNIVTPSREPTQAMIEACWGLTGADFTTANIWRAMWDAAPLPAGGSTVDVARDAEIAQLRHDMNELMLVIEDFMPVIGRCTIQNYARLNTALIAGTANRAAIAHKGWPK